MKGSEIHKQTDIQADRQRGKRTDGRIDRQTDGQMEGEREIKNERMSTAEIIHCVKRNPLSKYAFQDFNQ